MKCLLLVVLIGSFSFVKAQESYSFNQLDSLQNLKKKNVVVFVSTNWCSFCKTMDQVVFKDAEVAKLLEQKYYFIRLNAEDKNLIAYRNHKFVFNYSLGFHEMAISLVENGKLVFPSIFLINDDNEIIYRHEGFINSNNLLKILKLSY